jgi:hypothetical protein
LSRRARPTPVRELEPRGAARALRRRPGDCRHSRSSGLARSRIRRRSETRVRTLAGFPSMPRPPDSRARRTAPLVLFAGARQTTWRALSSGRRHACRRRQRDDEAKRAFASRRFSVLGHAGPPGASARGEPARRRSGSSTARGRFSATLRKRVGPMPVGVATCVISLAIHARRFAKSRHNTYGTSARTRAR